MGNRLTQTLGKFTSRKELVILVGILVLAAGVSLAWRYESKPTNLGPELQYVGGEAYGCIFGCDSSTGSTYYFATNLTPGQLAAYFRQADCSLQAETMQLGAAYIGGGLNCQVKGSGATFYPDYFEYQNSDFMASGGVIATYHLKNVHKHLIVSIGSSEYAAARAAL